VRIVRALRRRHATGARCAVSRAFGLARDAIVTAAGRAGVPVLDLTPFFCDSRCYPVIGGALVVRDANHLTGTYASTLGPYLVRAFDRLTAL
jgi:hypothetical protein